MPLCPEKIAQIGNKVKKFIAKAVRDSYLFVQNVICYLPEFRRKKPA